ncbi:MAG: uracil-DNA glycosylase family protein [Campylobacterota bacterium]|nr:uracil-DNA glycosylase family protein [Campylobacterota bacterium]
MFYHFHPFDPFLNIDTTKIIVGTLPPPRFCSKELKKEDVYFQYGSCDNQLWRVLNKIYDLDLLFDNSIKAIEQREEFLNKYNIGICDIVDSCYREKLDASDLGMIDIQLKDILSYLKKYPKIDTVIFTGGLCKNSPEYFFRKILKKQNIKLHKILENIPKTNQFFFENRTIKTISLTSPSNAANRSIGRNKQYKLKKEKNNSYTTFDFRVEQYKEVFPNKKAP